MLSDEKDCRTTCFAVCRDSIPFQFCVSAAVEPLKATVTKQTPSVHHSANTFSFIFEYVQPWVKLLTELCCFFMMDLDGGEQIKRQIRDQGQRKICRHVI